MAGIFYGWWIVLSCFFLAIYVGGTVFFGFTAFFEPIAEELGCSYTLVSIALSLRGVEIGILAPIMGFLVDRFGSRKLTFFGAIIIGFGFILLSLANSLVMLYCALILLGIGAGGCDVTVLTTAIANWYRRNVGKAIGIVACGYGVGGILIPLIAWLIDLYSWRTTLIILGLGMWALGIPLSFLIRHRPEHYGYLPDGKILAESNANHGGRVKEEVDFKKALKGKNFWKIAVAEAIRMTIIMAVITHVMPYLSSIGMSRASAAFVASSIPLFSIIGRFGFGLLSDLFDKRYILAGLYCLLGIGMLAFSCIHVRWVVFPFLLVFSPAFGGTVPLRGALLREYFGRVFFGRMMGILMGGAEIVGFIGPFAAGWTFDNLGRYQPVWFCFAGITIIAIVSILRIEPSPQISER